MSPKENKLGVDPLRDLWKAADRELVEGVPMDFQGVQEAVSREIGGYMVPEGLKDQLGFENLSWVLFEGPELTGHLYLGFEREKPEIGLVGAAVGTIAVREMFSSQSSFVRISGVDSREGRVIGGRYETPYWSCDAFCVSVSGDELNYAGLNNSDLFVDSVPSKDNSLHLTPAVITQRMVELTKDKQAFEPHAAVLSFPRISIGLWQGHTILSSRGLSVSCNDKDFELMIGYDSSQDTDGDGALGQLDGISIPSGLSHR